MTQVKCPTCGERGAWFNGDFGPFCSKRCRLIDLGKWFDGENAISEPLRPEHFAGFEDLPSDSSFDETRQVD